MYRTDSVQLYILDMEWSEKKGQIQPLEIGVVPVDTEIDPFFSLIRPIDEASLKPTIFSFLKTKKKTFRAAPDFLNVIKKLNQYLICSINEKRVAIVWHEDTAVFFNDACKTAGIEAPFQKIISLKNLTRGEISLRGRKSGFEIHLKEYNIPYNEEKLHDSAYDAVCLKQLFRKYRKKAETIQKDMSLVINTNSGIIHREKCYHNTSGRKNIRPFVMKDLYLSNGFCKNCCKGTAPWMMPVSSDDQKKILLKDKVMKLRDSEQFKETSVATMSVFFGFEYESHKNYIEINTTCGRWRVFHDGNTVTRVDHGNHRGEKQNQGFHTHEKLTGNLFSVLNYIRQHDNAIVNGENRKSLKRKKKPVNQHKKIVHHAKRNYYVEKDEWEEYYEDKR